MSVNVGGWMTRLGVGVTVLLIALMVMQAIAILGRRSREKCHLWSGVLALLLAAKFTLAVLLFGSASLVTIPSFGVLVVQGRAHILLRLFLFTIALSGGVFVQSARASRNRDEWWALLLVVGAGVGVWAMLGVSPIGQAPVAALSLYAYDLWSPALLCWICLCSLDWTLVILCLPSRKLRGWMGAALITGITLWACKHPSYLYFDEYTPYIWAGLLLVAWLGMIVQGARSVILKWFPTVFAQRRWARAVLALGCIVVSLPSLYLLYWLVVDPSSARITIAASTMMALLLVALVPVIARHWKERQGFLQPLYGLRGRGVDITLLVTLLSLLGFSCDLYYFRWLAIGCDLSGLALSVVLLIELISEGSIHGAPHLATAVWGSGSFARQALVVIFRLIGKLLSLLAWPFKRSEGSWYSKLLGKIAAVAVVVILVEEIPNWGKTLIYPLTASSLKEDDRPLGQVVADRLANRMAIMTSELKPDMLVYAGQNFSMASADSAVANGSLGDEGIEIGPAKVPVSTLVSLLRIPLNTVFGARAVTGTIQQRGTDFDLLLATSNGQAWHEPKPETAAPDAAKVAAKAESAPAKVAAKAEPASAAERDAAVERLFLNADRMAYRIVSSEPAWSRAGMTIDYDAFAEFDRALGSWNRYRQTEGYEQRVNELSSAIRGFRTAVALDPKFSVAQYRLGLALREDAQPWSAIQAFEAAIDASPQSGTALVALAATLYDFDSYTFDDPDAPPVDDEGREQRQRQRQRQTKAHAIWQRVVAARDLIASPTDRGSAFLGLCRSSFQAGVEATAAQEAPGEGEAETPSQLRRSFRQRARNFVEAYYYCARADAIYSRSASATMQSPEVLATRASIYNEMAVTLIEAGRGLAGPAVELGNGCSGNGASIANDGDGPVTWNHERSLFDDAALALLDQAHRLNPDDLRIGCSWAWTRRAAQDSTTAMAEVRSAAMLMQVGEDFVQKERETNDVRWLTHAFEQYQEALALEPMRIDTMNNFADAFWTGTRRHPTESERTVLEPFAKKAEDLAREAVRLGHDRESPTAMVDYTATLGEVLLARMRPHEAIEILAPVAVEKKDEKKDEKGNEKKDESGSAPTHAFYDEIRWALAQAYVCAAKADDDEPKPRGQRCQRLSEEAAKLYQTVRVDQKNRESPRYSLTSLDPGRAPAFCTDKAPFPRADPVAYEPAECEHSLILETSTDDPKTRVHVWGRGIDEFLTGAPANRVLLGEEAITSHQKYFVQLVGADRKPISPVFWLETFKEPKKNLARIAFKGGELVKPPARALVAKAVEAPHPARVRSSAVQRAPAGTALAQASRLEHRPKHRRTRSGLD